MKKDLTRADCLPSATLWWKFATLIAILSFAAWQNFLPRSLPLVPEGAEKLVGVFLTVFLTSGGLLLLGKSVPECWRRNVSGYVEWQWREGSSEPKVLYARRRETPEGLPANTVFFCLPLGGYKNRGYGYGYSVLYSNDHGGLGPISDFSARAWRGPASSIHFWWSGEVKLIDGQGSSMKLHTSWALVLLAKLHSMEHHFFMRGYRLRDLLTAQRALTEEGRDACLRLLHEATCAIADRQLFGRSKHAPALRRHLASDTLALMPANPEWGEARAELTLHAGK